MAKVNKALFFQTPRKQFRFSLAIIKNYNVLRGTYNPIMKVKSNYKMI